MCGNFLWANDESIVNAASLQVLFVVTFQSGLMLGSSLDGIPSKIYHPQSILELNVCIRS